MGSKTGSPATNGSGARKCPSWIDHFVSATESLGAPEIFRRWTAIGILGAVMEQKVWLMTSSALYANIYIFLTGHPGTGKSRTINEGRKYLHELEGFHLAPTSLTWASLVDALVRSKRTIIRLPDEPLEYNTMLIAADELGTFMHKYDKEMSDGLSAFYYPYSYGHDRRGGEIRIKIKSPQLSILCGSTPSNLAELLPEGAWGQGFMSRVVLVFSDEREIVDDFSLKSVALSTELLHDIRVINSIVGGYTVTEEYQKIVLKWREMGEPPVPAHPKLIHYNTRRREQLYKLSMISAIDRSNTLLLTKDDFNRAMTWLTQAESLMPDIFKAGQGGGDAGAMDELYHFVAVAGPKGIAETKMVRFLSQRVPAHSVQRVLELMEVAGRIRCIGVDDRTRARVFKAEVDLAGEG